MIGLLRHLAAVLAVIVLVAAPLGELGADVSPAMAHSTGTDQNLSAAGKMTCQACDQSAAGAAVCSADCCAFLGILAEPAIAAGRPQPAFSVVQNVMPEERALTPPTPPA